MRRSAAAPASRSATPTGGAATRGAGGKSGTDLAARSRGRSSSVSGARWEQVKPTGSPPIARSAHSSLAVGHKVFVFGGCGGGSSRFNDLNVLDVDRNEWTRVQTSGSAPGGRAGHSCNKVGDTLYVFGGDGGSRQLNDLYMLDLQAMKWSQITSTSGTPPMPRNSHATTLVGKKLFLFGGFGRGALNDMYILDTESNTWTKAKTTGRAAAPRCYHSMNAVKHLIYVFGGFDGVRRFNDVSVFDTRTMHWSRPQISGTFPPARSHHTTTRIGHHLYVFGGYDGVRRFNDCFALDVETMTWHRRSPNGSQPAPRTWHSATSMATRLAVFGGYNGARDMNDVWILHTHESIEADDEPEIEESAANLDIQMIPTDRVQMQPASKNNEQTGSGTGASQTKHAALLAQYEERLKAEQARRMELQSKLVAMQDQVEELEAKKREAERLRVAMASAEEEIRDLSATAASQAEQIESEHAMRTELAAQLDHVTEERGRLELQTQQLQAAVMDGGTGPKAMRTPPEGVTLVSVADFLNRTVEDAHHVRVYVPSCSEEVMYLPNGPTVLSFTRKAIFATQQLQASEYFIFGMYTYEFPAGSGTHESLEGSAIITTFDSTPYYKQSSKREMAPNRELFAGYLDFLRQVGFKRVYLWASPQQHGSECIFFRANDGVKTRNQERWYRDALEDMQWTFTDDPATIPSLIRPLLASETSSVAKSVKKLPGRAGGAGTSSGPMGRKTTRGMSSTARAARDASIKPLSLPHQLLMVDLHEAPARVRSKIDLENPPLWDATRPLRTPMAEKEFVSAHQFPFDTLTNASISTRKMLQVAGVITPTDQHKGECVLL